MVWIHENGEPDIVWSELDAQGLDSLRRYFNFVVDDIFREQWQEQLVAQPWEDDDD